MVVLLSRTIEGLLSFIKKNVFWLDSLVSLTDPAVAFARPLGVGGGLLGSDEEGTDLESCF